MGGDYTRFTFDPVKGFSGVLKQQGRVSLDSDANELEAILDRRDRAEMYDTVGQAVYPLTTPDAFKIGVNAAGDLTIGQGRLYVDGILAECFGDMTDPANTTFDEHLNDLVGKDPLDYKAQPFFYTSPSYPALSQTPGTINLVYLDVWQREVTVFEDYALREIALNGPDTATRVQTAWQVKVMQSPADAGSCLTPPPAWAALVAPSTARLTATTALGPTAPGPCVINSAGGYTGLENRLYRVEIHAAGMVDGATKATFKWSRDNASLAARVLSTTKVTATDWIVTVGSTGRDAWMRFEKGDHIELLDDDVEFAMRERGTGGILARITNVNHATGEIHVDQDLTALPIVASRHPRIRRWDYASAAEPLARDTNGTTTIALENGISVRFGPAATDTLHAGDHWVFAARTADGSIDDIDLQPPRNTLHHFAKLALVTSGSPPVPLSDCRIPWPNFRGGEGCCTEVVKVGEDIQAAIDRLDGIGGCVCLKMGVHRITAPLRIKQSNLTLHGEASLVTVQLVRGGPLVLQIDKAENVNVEGIRFEAQDGRAPEPMIALNFVRGGHIAHCALRITGEKPNPVFQAIGIGLRSCREYDIESVDMTDLPAGIVGRECGDIQVLDCRLDGPGAELPAAGLVSFGTMGIIFQARGGLAGIRIERNVLVDYQRGIQLGDLDTAAIVSGSGSGTPVDVRAASVGCRIVANTILRHAGVRPSTGGLPPLAFAIATHVARCDIVENAANIETLEHYGIVVAGGNTLVHRNEVRSTAVFDPNKPLERIPIGVIAIEALDDALLCSIRGNLFTGLQQAVVATGAGTGGTHRVDVLDNRIQGDEALVKAARLGQLSSGSGSPLVKLIRILQRFSAIAVFDLSRCRVADNDIALAVFGVAGIVTFGTSITANRVSGSLVGVLLLGGIECEVADNVIDGTRESPTNVGVGLLIDRTSVVARNAISRCAEGILTALCRSVRVQDNDVYRAGLGIVSVVDVDLTLRANSVEDAERTGITAMLSLHELTLAGERTLRCGYRAAGFSPSPAIGIDVRLAIALVTVEGCHVIDTGESENAAAPVFTAPRHGILLYRVAAARVRGCEIASKPLVPPSTGGPTGMNAASRALRIRTLTPAEVIAALKDVGRPMVPFADATDNVIEQSLQTLVEMVAFPEITFATNRCINFDRSNAPTVAMLASNMTVTGNRVKAVGTIPSLLVMFDKAMSAVGNMTTAGASVFALAGAVQVPAPYPSFNAAT
ncbi:MAG TPA: DUF6519 domain-containing protein [Gemmatimonadaceae bacterium]|nr:DUF6519 domain-containing protein [Gemmatimonadaceae bacterium]